MFSAFGRTLLPNLLRVVAVCVGLLLGASAGSGPRIASAQLEGGQHDAFYGSGSYCNIDNANASSATYTTDGRICNNAVSNHSIVECGVPGFVYKLCDIDDIEVYVWDGASAEGVQAFIGSRGRLSTDWDDCGYTKTSTGSGVNFTLSFTGLDDDVCLDFDDQSLVIQVNLPEDSTSNSCLNAWRVRDADTGEETNDCTF